ncbi:hypothetical protein N7497_006566 [Penicillium chrysogenum]|nr:hypothetical protein N7497_006566 [Penicillium chrysogenum]
MPKSKATTQKAVESPAREEVSLLDKLKLVVKDYLDRKVDEIQLRKTAKEVDEASQQYKTIPISSLSLEEAVKVLKLEHDDKESELKHISPVQLPPHLVETLALIKRASGSSTPTEASIRWVIDALLLHAHSIASSHVPYAQPINVQTERLYKHGPVRLNHRKVMLSARLDYGLWYGDNEAVCLNVLVVEAKKTDLEGGVAQALGYMGCIHRQRKKLTKRDCTVYGMASNGVGFSFLKISHDSKWSGYMVGEHPPKFELPLGILVYMLRQAAIMSPTHSKEGSAQSHTQEGSDGIDQVLTTVDEDIEMEQ